MPKSKRLTQARLKHLLEYNPAAGTFTWKNPPARRLKPGDRAGATSTTGFRQIRIDGVKYLASRLAWLFVYGAWPPGPLTHLNHIDIDERISNLALTDHAVYARDKARGTNNTSGVTGVSWHVTGKKWQAQITVNGTQIYLGLFKNLEDAIEARHAAEAKYGFNPKHGEARPDRVKQVNGIRHPAAATGLRI